MLLKKCDFIERDVVFFHSIPVVWSQWPLEDLHGTYELASIVSHSGCGFISEAF